jgi:hypothetical protein
LFVSSGLFVFWYHSPNLLDTPRTFIFETFKQMLCFKRSCRLNVRQCWTEHTARTYRPCHEHRIKLGEYQNSSYIWTLIPKMYGECTLNYRHSPSRHEMKGKLSLTGYLYPKEKSTVSSTHEYRRNWFLHLQRMPQHRIPLKSYHYSPQGKRTAWRPKKGWREQL